MLAVMLGACSGATHAEPGSRPQPPLGPAAQNEARNEAHDGARSMLVRLASAQAERPPTALGASPYGDFLAARHAERNFDSPLAAQLFARVLTAAPDNPALQRQTLHQLVAAGRIEDAVPVARLYLAYEPESVIAGLVLATHDLIAGDTASAEKRLAAMPQKGLSGYFVPLALAWTRVGLDNFEGALAGLEPLAKLRGGATFHSYHAALILDLKGDTEGAEVFLDRLAAENFAGYIRFAQAAGSIYERAGEKEKAGALYARFLERQPDSTVMQAALARLDAGQPPIRIVTDARTGLAEALANMATLLSQENVPEIAMMLTRLALALRPDFDVAQLLVGDVLEGQQRHEDAIAAYDRISRNSELSWPARLRAAQLLERAEKTEVAIARLRDMARERPERTDALMALGDLFRYKKRFGEAVEAYDAAFVRLDGTTERDWNLHYSRGIALERDKQWHRAEADFLKALEFRPDQPFVLNYLGYSWVEKGQHLEKALGMIERAVKLRPNDGYIVDSLGWAHYQLNDFDRAVGFLERAVELTPQDATINDHLGDAYWRVGRHYEARFQWRRALSLDPEPAEVPVIEKKLSQGLSSAGAKREASGEKSGGRGG